MARTEVQDTGQNSQPCWKARIWLPVAFKKKFHTHPLKPSPVSERSTYLVQN